MGEQGPKGERGAGDVLYIGRNCKELLDQGVVISGWYMIYPDGMVPLQVLCDMDTDGGGWIVFQRRYDGSVDFYLGWDSYKKGFGSRLTEFWLGNDNLSNLTSAGTWDLRVDLRDFDNAAYYAKYSSFRISPASDNYALTIGSFIGGNAGDALSYHNGASFSTKDRDNDRYYNNCAVQWPGAWWFNNCFLSDLNGVYRLQQDSSAIGIVWAFANTAINNYSFKISEMKIRPV
ncbi:ficolin-2 [Xenopus laevis]|nr:ficolin-2 [Xenopus laevis]